MDDTQAKLVAEQMKHALSLMRADIDAARARLEHNREMAERRLAALEKCADDHEARIRAATDGVTQFKMWSSLVSGGSMLAAITALLRSFLGTP
jgi:hypothetical protein